MLKINNNFKKYRIPLITMTIVASGIFLFQYLTFIPEYSSAEEISTPVYDETKVDTRTLSDITYMQEMTSGICNRSAENETKQLVDTRKNDDGNTRSYWVTKLVDGNCWMTQNLDLDLNGKILTSDDSDVAANWTSDTGASTMAGYNTDSNRAQYYDPGMYVYTMPTVTTECDSTNGLASCTGKGWTNVSSASMNASEDPNYGTSITNNTYNAHYLVGNYYSWAAATAGQSSSLPNQYDEATQSICPKGWTLPKSGRDGGGVPFNTNKSFNKLFTSYGVNSGLKYGDQDVRTNPIFFLYGGYITDESLANAGSEAYYRSSMASSVSNSYALYLNASYARPSGSAYRYYGFSVRCVNNPNIQDAPAIPEIDNPNISVTVDKILTMELSNKEVNIEPKTNEVMTGNFTATVSSNAGYNIGLSATEDSSTALVNKKDNVIVAEIPASNNIQVGNNGWGIKCIDDEDCILKSYNALTLYNNPQVYFSSTNAATNKPTNFEVGIGISPDLPSGTYSTNILVTASQK